MLYRIRILSLLVLLALVACQDNPIELPDMSVAVVEVAPNARTLTVGDTMLVQAYPKSASGLILGSAAVQWSSENQAVAQLTPRGQNVLVRAQSAGTVELHAVSEGKEGRVTLTVVEAQLPVASLQIADGADSVMLGQSVRFDAIARAADGTIIGGRSVTWQVNNASLGTIAGPADGHFVVLTAHNAGNVTLTASVEGKLAQRTIRLTPPLQTPVHSIMFDPPEGVVTLYTSDTRQLRVRAYDVHGTELTGRNASWRTADSAIATVDDTGRVTARGVGSTDLVATVEGKSASASIDVRSRITRIEMHPGANILAIGDEVTIQATPRAADGAILQRPITWRSSNDAVATVDANGRVVTRAAGAATITATAEGQQGWTYLHVVEWAQRPLLLIGDSTPPTTLFTRTTRDASGVERVTRVFASSGHLRMALTGNGLSNGKYQLVFGVVITVDGQAPQYGQYVYAGTFAYNTVNNTLTLTSYNDQTLVATPLLDGRIRITGRLEADLPVQTLIYGSL